MAQANHLGEAVELRAIVEQQTEKINQMMAMLEALTRQKPIVDPPPPVAGTNEDDWCEELESPRAEIPREENEKLEEERATEKERVEKLERVVCESYGVDERLLRWEGLFEGAQEKLPSDFIKPASNFVTPGSNVNTLAQPPQQKSHYQKGNQSRSNQGQHGEFTEFGIPLSVTLEQAIEKGHLKRLDPRPVHEPISRGYNAGRYCAYHQMLGHDTNRCMRLKHGTRSLIEKGIIKSLPRRSNNKRNSPSDYHTVPPPKFMPSQSSHQCPTNRQSLHLSSQSPPKLRKPYPEADPRVNPGSSKVCKSRKKRREFTDLGIPLKVALDVMIDKGHLRLLDPRPMTDPLPLKFDMTRFCAYHQTFGHTTDRCIRLRHDIQNLVDWKIITLPDDLMPGNQGLQPSHSPTAHSKPPLDASGKSVYFIGTPSVGLSMTTSEDDDPWSMEDNLYLEKNRSTGGSTLEVGNVSTWGMFENGKLKGD